MSKFNMENSRLCSICRNINFKELVIQHESQTAETNPIILGTTEELYQRSKDCNVCFLIIDAAERINEGQPIPKVLDTNSINCAMKPSYLGRVSDVIHGKQSNTFLEVNRLHIKLDPSPFSTDLFAPVVSLQGLIENVSNQDGYEPRAAMGRLFQSPIDSNLLKSWLHSCESSHGKACETPDWIRSTRPPENLMVIDVKRDCVMKAPADCRYVTLSYVWGQHKPFKVLEDISTETAIDRKQQPKTLVDAMVLVESIGETYLWIDSICIVQQEKELAEQIAEMDNIYSHSLMTIIAAAGETVEHGLPGIGDTPRRVVQNTAQIDTTFSLMQTAMQGPKHHLQYSRWNSRGWTFQERTLARRVLFVLETQVLWTCSTRTFDEETVLECDNPQVAVFSHALPCNDEWDGGYPKFSSQAYREYVTQYSERDLTYGEDYLPAFKGILRRMEDVNDQLYHWGLPERQFDLGLAWRFAESRREEKCPVLASNGAIHHVNYPSWSWLGWKGFCGLNKGAGDFPPEDPFYRIPTCELNFYKLLKDGSVTKIKTRSTDPDRSTTEQTSILQQQWKGSTIIEGPINLDLVKLYSDNNLSIHKDLANMESVYQESELIAFWTSHAKISLGVQQNTFLEGNILVVGKEKAIDISSPILDKIARDSGDMKPINHDIDFIVIARSYEHDYKADKLNLLMVEWDASDSRVARRIGMAKIDEEDWVTFDRQWKLVILA
jgi:hypothetical protein